MGAPSEGFSPKRAPGAAGARPISSKATRRATRRTAALANELNMHSFRIHVDGTVTWTLLHKNLVQAKPEAKDKPAMGEAMGSRKHEPSKRELRSRERARSHAALMQKAQEFRARSIIRLWSRAATPMAAQLTPTAQLSQSLPPTPPPPQLPPPQPPERQPPHSPQQRQEREGGVNAQKHARPAPSADDSPAGPRTKTHVVPLLPPPPSLPPSPPSPTPHPPPTPQAGTVSLPPPSPSPLLSHTSPPQAKTVSSPQRCSPIMAQSLPPSQRPPCDGCGDAPFIVVEGHGLCRRCATRVMYADGVACDSDSDD